MTVFLNNNDNNNNNNNNKCCFFPPKLLLTILHQKKNNDKVMRDYERTLHVQHAKWVWYNNGQKCIYLNREE